MREKKKVSKGKKVVLIVVAVLLVALIASVPWGLQFVIKQPVETYSDVQHSYDRYDLFFENNGKSIFGVAYVPNDADGPFPTIIMSHGLGSSTAFWERSAMSFAQSGFAVYTYDFIGGNDLGHSDGPMREMSLITESSDLKTVISGILKKDFCDAENLFLMGESMGGCVTAITAPEYNGVVKALVLYYPALMLADDARAAYAAKENIPDEVTQIGHTLGGRFYRDIYDLDIFEMIDGYKGPVLIIHGTKDEMVDLSISQKAVSIYDDARLEILDDEPHGFTRPGRAQAARLAYSFLQEYIANH